MPFKCWRSFEVGTYSQYLLLVSSRCHVSRGSRGHYAVQVFFKLSTIECFQCVYCTSQDTAINRKEP